MAAKMHVLVPARQRPVAASRGFLTLPDGSGSRGCDWTCLAPPLRSVANARFSRLEKDDLPMFRLKAAFAATLVLGTATLAFAESQDPDVKNRQAAMKVVGANTKALGEMAQGKTGFDAAAAQEAFAAIAGKAAEVPALFEAEVTDPESDAADEIWMMWDEFVEKAGALKAAAEAGAGADSPETLGAAFGNLNGACKACHTHFKL
jgi:cytochrome c556